MRDLVPVTSFAALAICAFALYAITYDTGRITTNIGALAEKLTAREAEIGVLRAELANLTRPGRIDRLVKAHLDLHPALPQQLGTVADLPWRGDAGNSSKDAVPLAMTP